MVQAPLSEARLAGIRRSKPRAPSSSGARADSSGSTRMAPREIAEMHAGYSPDEAHEPCSANLPCHHRLQAQLDRRRNVAHQRHRAAFAHAIDGQLDGHRGAHALQRHICAAAQRSAR